MAHPELGSAGSELFFKGGCGSLGTRYGFQSKNTFQTLTLVGPPDRLDISSWRGVPAVAPAMLHVTTTVRHLGHDLGMIWV